MSAIAAVCLLLILILQVFLTSSVSDAHVKELQIVNILQSTFMNTTNVLFLVDYPDNFMVSTSAAVLEHALKLFSHQRTFQLITLNTFLNRLEFNGKESAMIGKFKKAITRSEKNPQSTQHPVTNVFEGLLQNSEIKLNRNSIGGKHILQPETTFNVNYAPKGKSTDPNSYVENPFVRNLKLSSRTSMVVFLRNIHDLRLIREFSTNRPRTVKIVFFYNECELSEQNAAQKLAKFSGNIWRKFRILFTYFIVFCPFRGSREYFNFDGNEMAVNGNITWGNRFDNRTFVENPNLIQSLFVYNPLLESTSNADSRNSERVDGQLGREFGEASTIDLNEDHESIAARVGQITKSSTILNGNGHKLVVVAFTTPNTIKKSDFPFLSHQLDPKLLEDPFSSLDAFFGVEILIMRELLRRMNFTIQLVPVSDLNAYGWKLTNGTFVGALGDLLYRRADVCLNGFFIKDYETEQLFFTVPIQDDRICVAIQAPALIPHSLLLFKVFEPPVWLLVLCTFIAASILYSFVLCLGKDINRMQDDYDLPPTPTSKPRVRLRHKLPFISSNRTYNEITSIVAQCFRIIAVLLNAPLSHSFNSSTHERIVVVLCLLLGLNLTGSFQGSLMDVFTTPREYPSIDTLEELDKTGMLIILEHAGLQTDVFGSDPPGSILGNLRTKIKVTGVADDILLAQIGSGERFAALLRLEDLDRIKFKIPYRSDGKTLIHVIRDCPKVYNLAFLVNKSSELYATMNNYLGLIAAGGLLKKWISDSVYMFRLHSHLKNRNLLLNSNVILTLSHLQVAFFALFVGLFVSGGLFLAEVIWERRRMQKRLNRDVENEL